MAAKTRFSIRLFSGQVIFKNQILVKGYFSYSVIKLFFFPNAPDLWLVKSYYSAHTDRAIKTSGSFSKKIQMFDIKELDVF